ncbi:MAG: sterol desaturase family protein [Bdellovibrionota bacterium]
MSSIFQEVGFGPGFTQVLVLLIATGAVLVPLEHYFPANRQKLLGYKGMLTDLLYWFLTPILTRTATNFVLIGILMAACFAAGRTLDISILNGFGPLSRQPRWLQAFEILLVVDFVDYWTHRAFHSSRLWRIHAIHHSPEQMNWISSSRMHPLNDLITRTCQVLPVLALGFSANAVLLVLPYLFFYVVFLHSNLSWSFGPFRYLLVSPAYHRWHHTTDREGIDKNFAGIFPIWDLIFGTYHCPDRLPKRYGVLAEPVPEDLIGQLLFPLRPLWRKTTQRPKKRAKVAVAQTKGQEEREASMP